MKSELKAIGAGLLGLAGVVVAYPDEGGAGPVVELAPYVVTGTRTARLLSEAPVKTEVVGVSEMELHYAMNLRDALKLIPTARFENDCQNCRVNQIQLMGLGTDYTAILFDGAPLYSGLAKVYGTDLFPLVFIDRIEVIKGGSSALYGPEAIAGVVNLITAEPRASGLKSRVGYRHLLGRAGEWEGSMRGDYVDPRGRYSVSAYGFGQEAEAVDLGTDGFSEIPHSESRMAGLQLWWHPQSGGTLRTNYQFSDQAHRGGDQLDRPEEQARIAESLAHQIHLAQISWRHEVRPGLDYSLGASGIAIRRTSFYGARGDNEQRAYEAAGFSGAVTDAFISGHQQAIDDIARQVWGLTNNRVLYFEGQANHAWGAHTVSYGLQYRREDLKDGSLHPGPESWQTRDHFRNRGLFLQDQWVLRPEFEIVSGVRLDRHDNVDRTVVSPRLAARLFATPAWTLRASWSTGFNAPGAFNEDKHIGVNNGGAIFLVNEPGLREERSQTFSLGGEFRPEGREGLVLHSQVHHTRLRDSFDIDDSGEISGDPNLWLRVNGPHATLWVWENNLTWQWTDHLRLDVGGSYLHARLSEEVERVPGLVTDEMLKSPTWTGHLGISLGLPAQWQAQFLLSYTGPMLAVGHDAGIWRRTPSFSVLDVGLSKSFRGIPGVGNCTLAFGIENLFDSRQKDFQDNGEERDPTYFYGPTRPRSFYLSLSLEW